MGSLRGYPEVLLYVDEQIDVAKNITADDVEDFDHAGKLRMGFGEGMRISYFNGYLDDVRLWSVARTQEQIKAGMWGLQGTEPGLEGWWQFDAPNVDGLIKDFGPKQRHGNANGAAARLSRPALLEVCVQWRAIVMRQCLYLRRALSSMVGSRLMTPFCRTCGCSTRASRSGTPGSK